MKQKNHQNAKNNMPGSNKPAYEFIKNKNNKKAW